MKTLHGKILGLAFLAFLFLVSSNVVGQSTNYVGNWHSTAPVASMNNAVLHIKILASSHPNALIIINMDKPKKKIVAKYEVADGRLYASIKNTPVYLIYIPATDSLECYKTNTNAHVCNFIRN